MVSFLNKVAVLGTWGQPLLIRASYNLPGMSQNVFFKYLLL